MSSESSEPAPRLPFAEANLSRVFENGLSPNEMVALLRDVGFRAKLEERGNSFVIRSGAAGCNFNVYFFDALKGPDEKVLSLQFSAGFDIDPGQDARMARICQAFNVEWRYAKAYVRSPTLAYLDFDWYLKDTTEANLRYAIDHWERFLGNFWRRLKEEPQDPPVVLN